MTSLQWKVNYCKNNNVSESKRIRVVQNYYRLLSLERAPGVKVSTISACSCLSHCTFELLIISLYSTATQNSRVRGISRWGYQHVGI